MGLGLNPNQGGGAGEAGFIAPTEQIKAISMWDDFIANSTTGNLNWNTSSGTTITGFYSGVHDKDHQGILTGRSLSGNDSYMGLGQRKHMQLGGGVIRLVVLMQFSALSDVTDNYHYRFGLSDVWAGAPNNGVFIEYDSDNSANWGYATMHDGADTTTASAVAVAADTWYKLEIVINADASSVEYFVNDVSLGTITTNIPGVDDHIAPKMVMTREAGTTEIRHYNDFFSMTQVFTNQRY